MRSFNLLSVSCWYTPNETVGDGWRHGTRDGNGRRPAQGWPAGGSIGGFSDREKLYPPQKLHATHPDDWLAIALQLQGEQR